jgi:O-acetyl-ADP-ribose deacetylase (regulator of RNase III)
MEHLKLILVDPNAELCEAWRRHFANLPNAKIVNGRFETLKEFDCMVSAANSFGLMDGGVDLAIVNYFGVELMDRVQRMVLDRFLGEQPIGTSAIVETGHAHHPFIAHTPTMRVPMTIASTDYVYTAMWALLVAIIEHNRSSERQITTVACPGLGTATGQMPAAEAARQMAVAYRWYLNRPASISWPYAGDRQASIGRGGDLRLGLERPDSTV